MIAGVSKILKVAHILKMYIIFEWLENSDGETLQSPGLSFGANPFVITAMHVPHALDVGDYLQWNVVDVWHLVFYIIKLVFTYKESSNKRQMGNTEFYRLGRYQRSSTGMFQNNHCCFNSCVSAKNQIARSSFLNKNDSADEFSQINICGNEKIPYFIDSFKFPQKMNQHENKISHSVLLISKYMQQNETKTIQILNNVNQSRLPLQINFIGLFALIYLNDDIINR